MKTKVLFVGLVLLSAGAFYFRDQASGSLSAYFAASSEETVPTLRMSPRDFQVELSVEGELTGLKTTPIRAPRVPEGPLKIAWMAEEGKIVQPGETVVIFDNTDAQLAIETNQNTVESFDQKIAKNQAESDTELEILGMERRAAALELDYSRNQIRKDEVIFSRWEIQESIMSAALAEYKSSHLDHKGRLQGKLNEADRTILNIDKSKAQIQMDMAERTLSSLEVASDVEGVVLYKRDFFTDIEIGSEVWPGREVLEIADLRQFQGGVQIPEIDIAGVEPGQSLQVELHAFPGQKLNGTVGQLAKIAQQKSRSDPRKYFMATVTLDAPLDTMQRLKPGMRFRGSILIAHRQSAFVVPRSAVFKQDDNFLVFLQKPQEFEERRVEILESDHGFYLIEGVKEGEEVCMRHPFQAQQLHLPDFNAPSAASQSRRFVMFFD